MDKHRYFTLDEANALVPTLQQGFGRILQMRSQLRSAYSRLEELGQPPTPESLMSTEGPQELRSLRGGFRAMMEALKEEIAAIEDQGVQIKDLDVGLCDFLGRRAGQDVFLCWRYGETQIAFWHELDTGFAGRQPIAGAGLEGGDGDVAQDPAPPAPRIFH